VARVSPLRLGFIFAGLFIGFVLFVLGVVIVEVFSDYVRTNSRLRTPWRRN
jgi:hypothetical protein